MNIEEKLKEIICTIKEGLKVADIDSNKDLIDDYDMNSMDMLQFIAELEEVFDMELEDDELDASILAHIPKLVEVIERKADKS